MPRKRSHEIYADFYADVTSGSKRMAAAHGVSSDTASAWARPKASDFNPTATGKNNPLDGALRSMRVIHPHDPERARQFVALIEQECDALDYEAGLLEATEMDHPCRAIAEVIKRQSDLNLATIGNCDDPASLEKFYEKTQALKSSVIKLLSCLQNLRKEKFNLCEKSNDAQPRKAIRPAAKEVKTDRENYKKRRTR